MLKNITEDPHIISSKTYLAVWVMKACRSVPKNTHSVQLAYVRYEPQMFGALFLETLDLPDWTGNRIIRCA